jgi:TetR/AcrR family transcriptional regulator, transcriptional repressor for nem operon
MRYPAEETAEKHEKILAGAARLFREKGFANVSVGELMKNAGLTHGPFYNHFPSKEALMEEAIEFAMQQSHAGIEKYCGDSDGKQKYIAAYLSTAHRNSPGTGCPMAAMAVEVGREATLKEPFTRQLRKAIEKMTICFRWRSKGSARSEAIRAMSAMVGAMVLARAVNDESLAREILREVRQGL